MSTLPSDKDGDARVVDYAVRPSCAADAPRRYVQHGDHLTAVVHAGIRSKRSVATSVLKLQTLLLYAAAIAVTLVAFIAKDNAGVAASWTSANDDDDADDNEDEDDDAFDFFSSGLEFAGNANARQCSDGQQQCAADDASAGIASVVARGLVTKKPKVHDILTHHAQCATDVDLKAFRGETLGYVTPWNSRGYDVAKRFRRKFTYISPVWLQVREDPTTHHPIVTGTHDIDRSWLDAVRNGGGDSPYKGPAIVPRVVYERNKLASTDVPIVIDTLLKLCDTHAFDGVVFEIPVVDGTLDLLEQLGRAFLDANKLLLIVLNRSTKQGKLPITHDMLETLLPLVHRFSMNAYDVAFPGPNAPLPWLQTTLDALTDDERAKILLGLPFYGYDNNDAVTGPAYINLLATEDVPKIHWDARAHECSSTYVSKRSNDRHVVFYPCLQFIADRLALFADYGVGVAVWELGQGLDYFYDLL